VGGCFGDADCFGDDVGCFGEADNFALAASAFGGISCFLS